MLAKVSHLLEPEKSFPVGTEGATVITWPSRVDCGKKKRRREPADSAGQGAAGLSGPGVSAACQLYGHDLHRSAPHDTYCRFPAVMVNLHHQHGWIQSHLGDTPLNVSMRVFPRRLNREKAHLECVWRHPRVPVFTSLCHFLVHPNVSQQLDTPAGTATSHPELPSA